VKLKTGETAVICNFSGNYSIMQDEVQGFHWNNAQTISHPFVGYSKNEMMEHICFTVSSNGLKRDIRCAFV
jgi:hypothetical protein